MKKRSANKAKVATKKQKKSRKVSAKDATAFGLRLAAVSGVFRKNGW